MPHRRPLDAIALATLVLLCLSWGLQQVAVKLALAVFPPLTQMALRSIGACLIVLAWCLMTRRGRLFERDGTLAAGLLVGGLFAAEFILIFVGLQWTDASRSALFIYTAPFFVALGAHWLFPHERLGRPQWFGLLLSFAGVAVALGVPRAASSALAAIGDVMLLAAGALWAATTLAIRASRLKDASPEKVLLYQLVVSAVIAVIGAAMLGERVGPVTAGPVLWLLYQTVWVVGVTYVLWFRLLTIYPVSSLQAGTSMAPLFGVLSAALILGEPLTPGLGLAAVLVVTGLLLVSRPRPTSPDRSRVYPRSASDAQVGQARLAGGEVDPARSEGSGEGSSLSENTRPPHPALRADLSPPGRGKVTR